MVSMLSCPPSDLCCSPILLFNPATRRKPLHPPAILSSSNTILPPPLLLSPLSLSFCTYPLHLFICPPTQASNLQFYHSLNPIHSTCFISPSCLMNSQCVWVGLSAFHQTFQVKSCSLFVICIAITVKQSSAMGFIVLWCSNNADTKCIKKIISESEEFLKYRNKNNIYKI